MLKINGTGSGMDGRVHPDGEVKNLFCKQCNRVTPFLKKLGKQRSYILWIPLPSKEKDRIYWECDECLGFVYFGETVNIHHTIEGNRGGTMRDLTESEKIHNLHETMNKVVK
jgi:hypothetical protein